MHAYSNRSKRIHILLTSMKILFFLLQVIALLYTATGQGWREHVITETFDGPTVVRSVDMDNDGDYDVLASSYTDKEVAWFENKDGKGQFGQKNLIAQSNRFIYDVVDADFNCDGKRDIVFSDGDIKWMENLGNGKFGAIFLMVNLQTNSDFGINIDVMKIQSSDNSCRHNILVATWKYTVIKISTGDNWLFNRTNFYVGYDALKGVGMSETGVLYKAVGAKVKSNTIDNSDIYLCTENLFLWIDVDNERTTILGNVTSAYRQCKIETYDWNADGSMDVAVTDFGGNMVIMFEHPNDDSDIYTKNRWKNHRITINNPSSIRAFDIDGDNYKDFVISSYTDNSVVWYRNEFFIMNHGYGTVRVVGMNLDESYETFADDLDQDGDMDILVVSYNAKKISWFQNTNGMNMFGRRFSEDLVDPVTLVVPADFDNDGDIEFAGVSSSGGYAMFLYKEITAKIINEPIQGYAPTHIAIGDVNLDGRIDIFTNTENRIIWFLQTEGGAEDNGIHGSFGTTQTIHTTCFSVSYLHLNDFNGDGKLDLVATCAGKPGASTDRNKSKIVWYKNFGNSSFSSEYVLLYTEAIEPTSADMDQDGDNDIIICMPSSRKIGYIENKNNFLESDLILIDNNVGKIQKVEVCDINGDLLMDVVTVSYRGIALLTWYKNLGGGNFSDEIYIAGFDKGFVAFKCHDLDRDGDIDLGVSAYTDHKQEPASLYGDVNSKMLVFYNIDGNGNFASKSISNKRLVAGTNTDQHSIHHEERALIIFDIEGDTEPDFATLSNMVAYTLADPNCNRAVDSCRLYSSESRYGWTDLGATINLYLSRIGADYRENLPGSSHSKLKELEERLGHKFFQFPEPHLLLLLEPSRSYGVNVSSLTLYTETQKIFIRTPVQQASIILPPAILDCSVRNASCLNVYGSSVNVVGFEHIIFDGKNSSGMHSFVHSWTEIAKEKQVAPASPLYFNDVTFQNVISETGFVIYSETSPLTFINCTFQNLHVQTLIYLGYSESLYDWQSSSIYYSLECGGPNFAWLPMVAVDTVFSDSNKYEFQVLWKEYRQPVVATRVSNHSYPSKIEIRQSRALSYRSPSFSFSRFRSYKTNCVEKSAIDDIQEQILLAGIVFYSNSTNLNVSLVDEKDYDAKSSIAQVDDMFVGGGAAGAKNMHPCPPKTSWQLQSYDNSRCLPIVCNAGFEIGSNSYTCVPCEKGFFKTSSGSSQCTPCNEDTYADSTGSVKCMDCPVQSSTKSKIHQTSLAACTCNLDWYRTITNGVMSCEKCPLFSTTGHANATSISDCVCYAGYYRSITVTAGGISQVQCKQCPQNALLQNVNGPTEHDACVCQANFYDSNAGALNQPMVCTECPAFSTTKKMVNSTSVDACICSTGRVRATSISNNKIIVSCILCQPGKYTNANQDKCEDCLPGTYNENEGQSKCLQCDIDTYNEEVGSANPAQCKKCRTDYASNTNTNNEKGSSSRSQCVCDKGYYQTISMDSNSAPLAVPDANLCKTCPYGAICDKDDLRISTLVTKPAYWRVGINDTKFYLCENPVFCKGGSIATNGSASAQCIDGHEGPLCHVCKPGYAIQGNACKACPSDNGSLGVRVTTFMLAAVSFLAYNVLKLSPKCVQVEESIDDIVPGAVSENLQSKAQDKMLSSAGVSDTSGSYNDYTQSFRLKALASMRSKFRVFVGYLQINSALNLTFEVKWPASFQALIDAFKVINIDFSAIFTPISPCAFKTSFINQFYAHMVVLPMAVFLIFTAVAISKRICWKKEVAVKGNIFGLGMNSIVFWVFLLYPGMGTKIFRMFKCRSVGDKLYLVADFNTLCYEGEHLVASAVAILCIILYVIGIPLISTILLYKRRKDLDSEKNRKTFGSLYESYKPRYWYFECLEMLRKMILAGGLVIIRPGTSSQILLGLLVAFAFCLIVVDFDPYVDRTDNLLQQMCTIQVVLNLLIGLVLKLDNNATGEYEDSMIGGLLVVMNVGVVVITLILAGYSISSIRSTTKESLESLTKVKKKFSPTDIVPITQDGDDRKGEMAARLKALRESYGANSKEYTDALRNLK